MLHAIQSILFLMECDHVSRLSWSFTLFQCIYNSPKPLHHLWLVITTTLAKYPGFIYGCIFLEESIQSSILQAVDRPFLEAYIRYGGKMPFEMIEHFRMLKSCVSAHTFHVELRVLAKQQHNIALSNDTQSLKAVHKHATKTRLTLLFNWVPNN